MMYQKLSQEAHLMPSSVAMKRSGNYFQLLPAHCCPAACPRVAVEINAGWPVDEFGHG
jgi:hypothetical protein